MKVGMDGRVLRKSWIQKSEDRLTRREEVLTPSDFCTVYNSCVQAGIARFMESTLWQSANSLVQPVQFARLRKPCLND